MSSHDTFYGLPRVGLSVEDVLDALATHPRGAEAERDGDHAVDHAPENVRGVPGQ